MQKLLSHLFLKIVRTYINKSHHFNSADLAYPAVGLNSWCKCGYNPDWAVLANVDGEQKLYFVVETKGNINSEALRLTEVDKIACGRKHFEALGNTITFKEADDFDKFIENVKA